MKRINAALFALALLSTGCASSTAPSGQSVALGPDDNYWVVDPSYARVARVEPSGKVLYFSLPDGSEPTSIVLGPDGNLWFSERGRDRIGRVTASGSINEFFISQGAGPTRLASSPPDRIWFTESNGKVGVLTTNGAASEYAVSGPIESLAAAPGGGVVVKSGEQLIRLTPAGAVSVLAIK